MMIHLHVIERRINGWELNLGRGHGCGCKSQKSVSHGFILCSEFYNGIGGLMRVLAFWFAAVTALMAQTTSTEILGLVSDSSNAVVPGATVTITRTSTGERRVATTNQSGEYSFPLIEIGDYRVQVEMQGFKSQTVTGLHIELQQKARVNFRLEVGQRAEVVEVQASATLLKTEDAAVGQVIDNKRVIE